jgi:hypothetical protein
MPLYFIRNKGQVDSRVSYYIQGKDKTIYFTSQGLTYVLSGRGEGGHGDGGPAAIEEPRSLTPHEREERSPKARSRWVVKLDFVGAHRDVRPSGEEKTEGIISYFRGSPQEWKTGLPTYSRIAYRDLWPGIDLVYHGTTDRLKYEFIVHPGADPARIRLAYRGADTLKLNEKGRLKVETPAGGFEDDVPEAWQEVDGKTAAVAIAYELEGQEYGFQVGDYDRAQILALDPAVLVYCGYIGGGSYDYGYGIAVDGTGNAYVTGYTASTEDSFPVSAGPDLTYNGSADAFVVKVNSSGTALVYCGYIGGSDLDYGSGIAVDGAGNAYVTGTTASTESTFPVTAGPDLTYNGGWYDAFVAKVNSSGTKLSSCGYIGGSDHDHCFGIAVDIANSAYVTGYALSTEATFPVLAGPDLTHNGSADAFVAKVGSSGIALSYCGYIGGSDDDYGNGIALDSEGNAYITGSTDSSETTFPVALGPDLTYNGGSWDAYVATVNSTGTALRWCGYIGGSEFDEGHGIAADSAGNAYITGTTGSDEATFPVDGDRT